ncbi:MAG: GNAT family N-acetyltransferase [Candidatus Thorarchaeota archaeon]|jgi:GNAT superfamily N-acetyltransferase
MNSEPKRFKVVTDPTDDEVKEFQKGLEDYNMRRTDGEFNSPEEWLNLVLNDHDGNVVGGITTSTLYWAQYLETFWVDKKYRGQGYGRDLLLEAERLAKKNGCVVSQTYTFSWQAPDFYQAAGYELKATYDGYVEGITELILMKSLSSTDTSPKETDPNRFTIHKVSSEEALKHIQEGMREYSIGELGDLRSVHPEIGIKLVIKNDEGKVIGGLAGYTTLGTMNFGELWVHEDYRNQGYGKDLLTTAESLAKEKGCIAGQTACFIFQNLDFLKSQGYNSYGILDGYPKGAKEHLLIKRFEER